MTESPGASADVAANLPEYTVSEVSFRLKRIVEDNFAYVRIRGEISGFTRARSGHLYMSLKDDKAVLDAVCWKGVAGGMRFQPEDGLEVVCTGKLSTYPARSRYQLVIERMEPAGIGALMALLEERRKKLLAEGLFDEDRKQPLPVLPDVIGVVTSPTGAVIRDILHRLRDRFPRHVLVWPVLVQGDGAAEQIAAAIRGFNQLSAETPVPRPDLLIVARGGGSIEDLWAFNEEIVVRAAAASEIPLISAVGHETDTTLIDFASDRRAPTPTAAAEMAVPVRTDLMAQVTDYGNRQSLAVRRLLADRQRLVEGVARGLRGPRDLLALAIQRFDDTGDRLDRALVGLVNHRRAQLQEFAALLRPRLLLQELARRREALGSFVARMGRAGRRRLQDAARQLDAEAKLLQSLSYKSVLARGYAVVRDGAGLPVAAAAETTIGAHIGIEFRDGSIDAEVIAPEDRQKSEPQSKPKPSSKRKPAKNQGELF